MSKGKLSRRQAVCLVSGLLLAGMGGVSAREYLEDELSGGGECPEGNVPLIYSHRYNISAFGIERLHPFDGSKYRKIHDFLIRKNLRRTADFLQPEALSQQELELVHTGQYLRSLERSRELARILEVPLLSTMPHALIDWRILKPMRLACSGTVMAARLALSHGLAINIGGGYHHAGGDRGGGFCVYADIPTAIASLRMAKPDLTALIVDTDAHQGDGFASLAARDEKTFVLDFFEDDIYPFPKVDEDMAVPLPSGTNAEEYMRLLAARLPAAIETFRPDLIFYNAGSDVLSSDPLSRFQIEPEDMVRRDFHVVSTAREKNIPLAMVLAGGYSSESARAHALSIAKIISTFDRKPVS
ncbi:MAG: histone deacetylase [Cyanobacteria bacterium HKST-UBA02]|nr:histone deacetylase [Cyanobacteria bacterium HKST-UBA02]